MVLKSSRSNHHESRKCFRQAEECCSLVSCSCGTFNHMFQKPDHRADPRTDTFLHPIKAATACVLVLLLKHVFVCQEKQMMVYVERRVADDATLSKDEAFGSIRNQLCTFREGETSARPTANLLLFRHVTILSLMLVNSNFICRLICESCFVQLFSIMTV